MPVIKANNPLVSTLYTPPTGQLQFTVNNAVASVPVINVGPGRIDFVHASGNLLVSQFQSGDNGKILSFGLMVPAPYVSISPIEFRIGQFVPTLAQAAEFSGFISIPFSSYEMATGTFVNSVKYGVPGSWYLNIAGITNQPNISMLNVPDSENGKTYNVRVFVKIEHNLELV